MAMSDRVDLDRILGDFFIDGPSAAPDRAIEDALLLVAATDQRSVGRIPWRDARSVARFALVAALLAVTLLTGVLIAGGLPRTPDPIAPVSPPAEPVSPPAEAAPSASAAASAPAQVGSPVALLATVALARVDVALAAAGGDPAAGAARDAIGDALAADDVAAAAAAYVSLPGAADRVATGMAAPAGMRLRQAVDMLGGVLGATPIGSGPLPAGTYHTTSLSPTLAITLGDGWTRHIEYADALSFRRGGLSFGLNRNATSLGPDGVAQTLGRRDPASLPSPPRPVSFASYAGYTGEDTGRSMTVWYTDGLAPIDSRASDLVRTWVLDAEDSPITAYLVGPPDAVEAATAEIERALGSLVVRPRGISIRLK